MTEDAPEVRPDIDPNEIDATVSAWSAVIVNVPGIGSVVAELVRYTIPNQRLDRSTSAAYLYSAVATLVPQFFAAVSESEIREARSMVEEMEKLSPCFTSSAALAGMIRMVRKGALPSGDTVLVNVPGRDRDLPRPSQKVNWLRATADGWELEDPNDEPARRLWFAPRTGSSPVGWPGDQHRRPMEDPRQ